MENDKRSILEKINPSNYRYSTKISLLVLLIILLVITYYSISGMISFRNALIRNEGHNLEELCYVKSSEVSIRLRDLEKNVLTLARSEGLRNAAQELSTSFSSLTSDKGDMLYGDKRTALKSDLLTYYEEEVLTHSPLSGNNVTKYVPVEDHTMIAQYLYLVSNPKDYTEKEKYIQSNDRSVYSMTHAQKHRDLVAECKKSGASDLLLIDPKTGNVVYSMQKNINFGVNLYKGIHKEGKLSEAFRAALVNERMSVHVGDYSNYMPASDKPVILLSVPVYYNGYLVTVLVLQYGIDLFDNLLLPDNMLADESTLEFNILGADLKLRNTPKKYITGKDRYKHKLFRGTNKKEAEKILKYDKLGSLALYSAYPYGLKQALLNGGIAEVEDYKETKVLLSSATINFSDRSFPLVAQIDYSEIAGVFYKKISGYFAGAIIFIAILVILARIISKKFSFRLTRLSESIELLYKGEKSEALKSDSLDELGVAITSYNSMRKRLLNAETFALEMSEGNYNYNFDILSERDSLGKSLNVLKDKLTQSKEDQDARAKDDEIRNWINSGIAKFNDLLRANNDNIKELAYSIIENMVAYVDANIGGVYLVEGDKEADKKIELLAAFAYDRRKYEKQVIKTNEGLLGACYQEKKPIFLKQIPDDYIEIGSGLGSQVPSYLYIVPLLVDGNVLGIIEIASFNEINEHCKELINKLADSIAATFVGVRLNMKTVSLLEESNRRAEEITQQEEEMRQNLEEMQATQEELARLRQDDERKTNEMQLRVDNTRTTLKNLIDAIPGGYNLKDQNGVIHLINMEGAAYYGLTIDRVTGKTDHELLGSKQYDAEHQKDLEALDKGKLEYTETVEADGKTKQYQVIKKTFMMPELGQNGVLTIRHAIKAK